MNKPSSRALAALLSFCLLMVSGAGYAQQPLQKLHSHVRPVVASGQAILMGEVPSTQRMNLAILLPLRNQAELTALLGRQRDPASADYHKYLSVAQFTAQFSPTEQDYQQVVEFAKANGLAVTRTPANRLIVDISGSAGQVEAALHVKMGLYQHPTESRTFYSPDREPSLALAVPVSHIAGLNDYSIPHPRLVRAAMKPLARGNVTGSGPDGSYRPSDLRAAYYGGSALTGSGQSVGVLEFGGYEMADVTGDEGGVSYSVPIVNVPVDGASATGSDDGEQALDIAQAIGMAPGLSSVRVYIAPASSSIGVGDVDIFNQMAIDNISKSLSCSWGWNPDDTSSDDPIFQELQAQGQTLFVASGDAGAYTGSNTTDDSYPAEDVYVTAVGGTDLTTSGAGGAWASETAWADSSGGPADNGFALPSWQAGIATAANDASTSVRNLPDVAAEANFDNILCQNGSCVYNEYGGTSYAAPRWAGFIALINQQSIANGHSTVGFINPAIYAIGKAASYDSDFHDITSGNNNNGDGRSYNAVVGYDLVTGWGSPNGQSLINALAGGSGTSTGSVTLAPTSVAFGNQTVNTASSAQTITLSNGTASAVSITSVAVSGSFSQTNSCGSSLAANGSCTISVKFTPTATGAASGTLTVTDAASGSPQTATLSGTGVSAGGSVSLSPASLNFGSQEERTSSASQTLTLTNGTASSVTISSITLSSSSFGGSTSCGSTLAAGGSCTISLFFRPRSIGSITATLDVNDNAANSPQAATLSGTGTRR